MNNTDNQSYEVNKSVVSVSKVSKDDRGRQSKRKLFDGLVTQITSRGLIINPINEEGGECLDVLAGSFIPFEAFCDKFEIRLISPSSRR